MLVNLSHKSAFSAGAACQLARQELEYDSRHIKRLSDRLIGGIRSQLDHVVFNGDEANTYPGCVNMSFAYVEGESLLMALKDVALSSGSACTSASLEPSYVLRAIGADEDLAHSSIRFLQKLRRGGLLFNETFLLQVRHRTLHYAGGGRLHRREGSQGGEALAGDVAPVGNVPGGNRHQIHSVDAALRTLSNFYA